MAEAHPAGINAESASTIIIQNQWEKNLTGTRYFEPVIRQYTLVFVNPQYTGLTSHSIHQQPNIVSTPSDPN